MGFGDFRSGWVDRVCSVCTGASGNSSGALCVSDRRRRRSCGGARKWIAGSVVAYVAFGSLPGRNYGIAGCFDGFGSRSTGSNCGVSHSCAPEECFEDASSNFGGRRVPIGMVQAALNNGVPKQTLVELQKLMQKGATAKHLAEPARAVVPPDPLSKTDFD